MKSECLGCDEKFTGMTLFDAHRVGSHGVKEGENRRRCMSKDEMKAAGWVVDGKGYWFDPIARVRIGKFATNLEKTSNQVATDKLA